MSAPPVYTSVRRARKTVAQREMERADREERVWQSFYPKLQAVTTLTGAVQLLNSAVAEGTPGRCFYSNLGFFLMSFAPPMGASRVELEEYKRMIACFDEEGALVPGARQKVEAALNLAIRRPGW